MISIFSIISAFLSWHNWQSSRSFSPQAELGHQHNPLSCFQMTQFSSIIAQIPLNVFRSGGSKNETSRLLDEHRSAISEPKMKLLLSVEIRYQQGKDVEQLTRLAAVAEFLG